MEMNEIKLKALKQEYDGKCVIIPCADLPKYEKDAFDDTRNDIIEAVFEKRVICDWIFKDNAFDLYEDIDDDDVKDEFWEDIVCSCFKTGFLVIYTHPVPRNIKKKDGKIVSWETFGFGYTQTRYIHLEDIAQLSAVLSNIDDRTVEKVWKEENEKKGKDDE
jgi:hypothetical protein